MSADDFGKELTSLAGKITKHVNSASGPVSAWDLKMTLKTSHTRLHLALGMLLQQRAITLTPDSQTFRVESASGKETITESAPAEAIRQA
jgi:hypothetical protein